MGRWKIGSFTAAIGCIIVGAIVVMAQYGVITYDVLGYIWPALLILFGLEMLLRLFIKSDVKSRVSGWAIVLIVVLVAASGAQTVLAGESLSSIFGNTKLVPVNGNVEVQQDIKNVRIDLPQGKVKLQGVEGNSLTYEGKLELPGNTDNEAASALERKWKVTTEGDTLVMELEGDSGWLSNIQIGFNNNTPYLNVSIPQNLAAQVETSDGSIEAAGLAAGINVDTSNGTMDIHDVTGGVKAHSSNGTLTVKNVQGGVDLVSSNGAITLGNINGAVSARSSNGKITVNSGITGAWELKSSNGKIVLGLPAVTDAKITADTSNGSLKGNVDWGGDDEDHGTAVLGKGTHEVTLSTSNGSITVDTAQ
ncbi:LiaI-LiaF-like domain-containing protein [Paenibacillus rhizoplanae]|uniref:LiaI-LiaF-like domain-containing protein n=1 Tax=Paenibacillus rhizoplanae TaxID=1917181 RepID=A0ABW5FCB5_9BACL